MNKLSKEKRDQLILTIVVTLLVLAGLWFGLINFQRTKLNDLEAQKKAAQKQLDEVEATVAKADTIKAQLISAEDKLGTIEKQMASGDIYSWMVNAIRQFKLPYRVDIPQFSTIVVDETRPFPNFPYKQVTMTISGTAYYHELGRFIADFENFFSHMRVEDLDMAPASSSNPNDREKLSFKMNIVALVKPGAS